MDEDGPTVLVAGTERDRVDGVASRLADRFAVRTYVATEPGSQPATDVEAAVFTDGVDEEVGGELPADAAQVAVLGDREAVDDDPLMPYDRVVSEPLVPGSLVSTVTSLARQVQYDRRLEECAELAAQWGRAESNRNGGPAGESRELRKQVDDVKAELDGLVAEFSSHDFRQAFRTIAAD